MFLKPRLSDPEQPNFHLFGQLFYKLLTTKRNVRLEIEVKNEKNQTYRYFSWMLLSNQSYIFHSLLCKRVKKSLVYIHT